MLCLIDIRSVNHVPDDDHTTCLFALCTDDHIVAAAATQDQVCILE